MSDLAVLFRAIAKRLRRAADEYERRADELDKEETSKLYPSLPK